MIKVIVFYERGSICLELPKSASVIVAIDCALDYISQMDDIKHPLQPERFQLLVANKHGQPDCDLPPLAMEAQISNTNLKAFYLRMEKSSYYSPLMPRN